MTDVTSQQSETQQPVTAPPPVDRWAARFRERVTAAIAGALVLTTALLIVLAATKVGSADRFGRIKDLLLFVNPVVGVVIGYYFNRVSTETRAENAEHTASAATEAATEANRARDTAAAAAERSRAALGDVVDAADAVAAESAQRTLGEPAEGGGIPQARLAVALDRARRELGRGEGAP